MTRSVPWTSADLELFPDDGKRYEIVDGELFVSKQSDWNHQLICLRLGAALDHWSSETVAGVANAAPGILFGDEDDVAPDVVWISRERLSSVLAEDGKLHGAPDLVVEVLSPGPVNERRDREAKLKLYSQRGVREYWIVDWRQRKLEVYRRQEAALQLIATLYEWDTLSSPLLAGFSCPLWSLFAAIPSS